MSGDRIAEVIEAWTEWTTNEDVSIHRLADAIEALDIERERVTELREAADVASRWLPGQATVAKRLRDALDAFGADQ